MELVERGIDLRDYHNSTEWDLLAVPAQKYKKYYTCCTDPYPDIKFNITIRRKTLFYTVNLIFPCVAICSVTLLVFYIPASSGEKITMGITILNSLNIFLLLVAEINPPTSLATPLIGKYLLFTMVLVTCSIIITVFVLNVHFRSPTTHVMSPWVRELFLNVLPRLLLMQRPISRQEIQLMSAALQTSEGMNERDRQFSDYIQPDSEAVIDSVHGNYIFGGVHPRSPTTETYPSFSQSPHLSTLPPAVTQAMIGVNFIAEHLRYQDECKKVQFTPQNKRLTLRH